jgi:PhnB protein
VQILLNFTDLEQAREKFAALTAEGKVIMPLEDSFWGATFGIVNDAFGVRWLFNCEKKS